MRVPTVRGVIDRRILVNYRIDPAVMAANLPSPFQPKLIRGFAIGGICLIRLKRIRPKWFPLPFGVGSENAAHRIAVTWPEGEGLREGVFIPRRDTSSRINAFVGGRVFPGVHDRATFEVVENSDRYCVSLVSDDGVTRVRVDGTEASELPPESMFESLAEVSDFFERGSLGYSTTRTPGHFDGLELVCKHWKVRTLSVADVESSYFEDVSRFPLGSIEFDCALLMKDIFHEWHSRPDLRGPSANALGSKTIA